MGLCAGFAVADFKPICWGKIGLVYHPSFIVHIVFVNPSNYISPCCCHSFLPLFSFFFCPRKQTEAGKNKRHCCSENQIQRWTLAQPQWAIKCRPQSVDKQKSRSSLGKQWLQGKITCWEKRRQSCCYMEWQNSVVFLSRAHTQIDYDQLPTSSEAEEWVGVSRQKITRLESMGNQFGFLFKGWSRYRMSKAIVVSPTAITCFFYFLNIYSMK